MFGNDNRGVRSGNPDTLALRFDRRTDPGERTNRWSGPAYAGDRLRLTQQLPDFTLGYQVRECGPDIPMQLAATPLVQFGGAYWSDLQQAAAAWRRWPPEDPLVVP